MSATGGGKISPPPKNAFNAGTEIADTRTKPTPEPAQLYNLDDLFAIIQTQQSTINQLTLEITKKSNSISRDAYEKTLNDYETEKYEHAKTKLEVIDARDTISAQSSEIEYLKNELEKERRSYNNVFELLKDKALNEGTKSIDLVSRITETEIKYNDALHDVIQNERKYTELCGKIKQKEQSFEHKMQELNLKVEQDKFISKLINEQLSVRKKH